MYSTGKVCERLALQIGFFFSSFCKVKLLFTGQSGKHRLVDELSFQLTCKGRFISPLLLIFHSPRWSGLFRGTETGWDQMSLLCIKSVNAAGRMEE